MKGVIVYSTLTVITKKSPYYGGGTEVNNFLNTSTCSISDCTIGPGTEVEKKYRELVEMGEVVASFVLVREDMTHTVLKFTPTAS